jgi:hypothetical protein
LQKQDKAHDVFALLRQVGVDREALTSKLIPLAAWVAVFRQSRVSEKKRVLEGSIVRKWVYALSSRKAKESIPAKGGDDV